ncbi:MBL fold metallo-hydrolase [Sinirhodobacter sp. WL0062]|uniref:MBL fold metallo-hydrolase n=1 Tax=Rhodobacter flavimaris TaxID=2907145 RepID=A0ABS8YVL9_9RHOB|nr:MBL fold metallo-hydrolase [Sinirhodobacter sp. WL0062]MCE5972476.1 MBL fold metallo-hydrolase [Sinirhodobacter sp. WL0062]
MVEVLEPGLRRIVAPNPSPMTLNGTCTYILGTGAVAVIDPGPADRGHIAAILAALAPRERISHILVTHAHLDHSPGARLLAEASGAKIHAFGPASAGRSPTMERLAATGLVGGGEGVDLAFAPDILIADGEEISGADWSVRALHTPGHFCNHLSFIWRNAVFTGDHVMGWSSTLISPPDGDLGDYFRSLEKLAMVNARIFYPGHGAPVTGTAARIAELAAHRRERTAQIAAHLQAGAASVTQLTERIYQEIPTALMPAASRNVFAHLIEMTITNHVSAAPEMRLDAVFSLA